LASVLVRAPTNELVSVCQLKILPVNGRINRLKGRRVAEAGSEKYAQQVVARLEFPMSRFETGATT